MLDLKDEFKCEVIDGKSVDFYLEDDMFEIEGRFQEEGDKVFILVVDAVSHMLKIAGEKLEIGEKYKRLIATRTDNGRTFDLEINRIFLPLTDPTADDFKEQFDHGITQFFNKADDTLVWYNEESDKWFMEINKINMYSSGDIHQFDTLDELFEKSGEYTKGRWQCIYFSAEVEEDGEDYFG